MGIIDTDEWYGNEYVPPMTEVERKIERQKEEDHRALENKVAEWNTIGQYARIYSFVYPFTITMDVWDAVKGYSRGNVRVFPGEKPQFYGAALHLGKEKVYIYRLADADPSDPWLMQDEFRQKTNHHPSMNVKGSPWW